MKKVVRAFSALLFIPLAYATWANSQWVSVDNKTGVMETCRWKDNEGIKVYDCLIRLSDSELAAVNSFVLDNESHTEVTLKVEVNRLRKSQMRYSFISSS